MARRDDGAVDEFATYGNNMGDDLWSSPPVDPNPVPQEELEAFRLMMMDLEGDVTERAFEEVSEVQSEAVWNWGLTEEGVSAGVLLAAEHRGEMLFMESNQRYHRLSALELS